MSDLPGARTLGDLLDWAAASAERGVRLTVEAEDGTTSSLTYPELVAASWQAAGGLAAFGIEPGDRVAITAGIPLGTPGATNMLRIAFVRQDGAGSS